MPFDAERNRLRLSAVSEQAVKADDLVDEALDAGPDGSHPITVHAKMLRLELLNVKKELERELETLVLNCSKCGLDVHWVSGLGITLDTGHTGSPRHIISHRSDLGRSPPRPQRRQSAVWSAFESRSTRTRSSR